MVGRVLPVAGQLQDVGQLVWLRLLKSRLIAQSPLRYRRQAEGIAKRPEASPAPDCNLIFRGRLGPAVCVGVAEATLEKDRISPFSP